MGDVITRGFKSVIARKNVAASGITFQEISRTSEGFIRSPVVNYPSTVADDIWIAVGISPRLNSFNGTAPAGWTKLHEQAGASETLAIYWKRATGSEGATETWTDIVDTAHGFQIFVLAYRNCVAAGSPIDVSAINAATGSAYDIGATSTVNDVMTIAFLGYEKSPAKTFIWDGGITELLDSDTTPSGEGGGNTGLHIGEKLEASSGAYSMGGDLSSINYSGVEATIALAPL